MSYQSSIANSYLKPFAFGVEVGILYSLYKTYSVGKPSDLLSHIKTYGYHDDAYCRVYKDVREVTNSFAGLIKDAISSCLHGGILSVIGAFVHDNLTQNPLILQFLGITSSLGLYKFAGVEAQSSQLAVDALSALGGAYIAHQQGDCYSRRLLDTSEAVLFHEKGKELLVDSII